MTAEELWQLFDEQGRPIVGKGASKQDMGKGLLHAAAHVWIWRHRGEAVELLLQKRAGSKRTWPNKLDVSAAGHINLGEEPIAAALRETQEELGLTFTEKDLRLISVVRCNMPVENTGIIENEFHWMYLTELNNKSFRPKASEVGSTIWKKPGELKADIANPYTYQQHYLPHVQAYFAALFEAVEEL
jgi:isopentenyl-diphosphate delta-isomerase